MPTCLGPAQGAVVNNGRTDGLELIKRLEAANED
jgi:hypothetical protein